MQEHTLDSFLIFVVFCRVRISYALNQLKWKSVRQIDRIGTESLVDSTTYWKCKQSYLRWWRHQMKKNSALLALCAGNSPVTGEFPTQRPVTRNFYAFFDLRVNKRLSKQSWGWRFENAIELIITSLQWEQMVWEHNNFWGKFLGTKCHISYGGILRLEIKETSDNCEPAKETRDVSQAAWNFTRRMVDTCQRIGLSNGLARVRRQANIWTNANWQLNL